MRICTGAEGMRRLHVRGHENVLKRLLIQVSAFNLGMLMRQSLGVGTPRGLQGRICALMLLILSLFKRLKGLFGLISGCLARKTQLSDPFAASTRGYHLSSENVLPPRAARQDAGRVRRPEPHASPGVSERP